MPEIKKITNELSEIINQEFNGKVELNYNTWPFENGIGNHYSWQLIHGVPVIEDDGNEYISGQTLIFEYFINDQGIGENKILRGFHVGDYHTNDFRKALIEYRKNVKDFKTEHNL